MNNMKKMICIVLVAILFFECNSTKIDKSVLKEKFKPMHNNETSLILDSLLKLKTSYASVLLQREKNLRLERGHCDCKFQIYTTVNQKKVAVGTSDNNAVMGLFDNITSISPIDFVVKLRSLKGEIDIEGDEVYIGPNFAKLKNTFPDNWIKREHLSTLLELTKVPAPSITLKVNNLGFWEYTYAHNNPRSLVGSVGLVAAEIITHYYLQKQNVKIPIS